MWLIDQVSLIVNKFKGGGLLWRMEVCYPYDIYFTGLKDKTNSDPVGGPESS